MLFWAQDRIELKQTLVRLENDPTSVFVDYVFSLKHLAEGAWEVTVSVDGSVRAAVSGLDFPNDTVLTIYTWNVDGYVPPFTDPLTPFRTVSRVTEVKTPLRPRRLCSYGSPFHDVHGIKEVWVGVSSSYNDTANVAPFQLIRAFCTPCLLGCQNLCSATCLNGSLPSGLHILPLTLTNLSLEAASEAVKLNVSAASSNTSSSNSSAMEALDAFRLPVYYLDVRVVSQGGLVARAKSSALSVDTSPPLVEGAFCFDPSYADDQPVDYVGVNNSVGLRWDVSEDVSTVASQRLCIGTRSGLDDVVPWLEVDRLASKHVISDFNSSLEEGGTYHLSIEVVNAAGLSTIASVPFIVSTTPPDMSVMSPTPGPVVNTVNVSGVSVAFTNSTNTVSLNLNFLPTTNDSSNTLYLMDWSIGTQPGRDDIFPKTVVANRNVTQVAIVGGYLELHGLRTNITVQDYVSVNTQLSTGSGVSGTVFSMEPGRCLRQSLTGVSLSQREAAASSIQPLCIQRDTDQLVLAGNSTVYVGVNRTTPAGAGGSAADDIEVHLSLNRGGVLMGGLGTDDLNAVYGTAASSRFSPYIVLPDPLDPTSRVLRKRLLDTPGPHFFLSPVADVDFADDVEVLYNMSVSLPPGYNPTLLLWDAESEEWKIPEELCRSSTQTYNNQTQQIRSLICLAAFTDVSASGGTSGTGGQRRKRSVSLTAAPLNPRMFTVAVVSSALTNTPPVIQNITLVLLEDDLSAGVTVSYTDAENDVLSFSLLQPSLHGTAAVTTDGTVTYVPAENYVGDDVVLLQGVEVLDAASTAAGMVPNVVNISLPVSVIAVNDPPAVVYLTGSNDSNIRPELLVSAAAGNGINVSVLVEGNTTSFVDLGLLVFGDVDANDTLLYLDRILDDVNATFSVSNVSLPDPRLSALSVTGAPSGVGAKAVSLSLGPGYRGRVSYDARVRDAAATYSLLLTLGVHVMISPCFHGECRASAPGDSCLDPQRALTFQPFRCHCHPGYKGEWCEEETDECLSATCSPITDCVDLINGYRCDPNPEKTAAIIICSILAVVLILAAVWKWKRKSSKIGSQFWASDSLIDMPKRPSSTMSASDLILEDRPPSTTSLLLHKSSHTDLLKLFPYQPRPNPARNNVCPPARTPAAAQGEANRTARPPCADTAPPGGLSPPSTSAGTSDGGATRQPFRSAPGKSRPRPKVSRLARRDGGNSAEVAAVDAKTGTTTSTLPPLRHRAGADRDWAFQGYAPLETSLYDRTSGETMETTFGMQTEADGAGPSGPQARVVLRGDGAGQDDLRVESSEGGAVSVDGRRAEPARPPSAVSHMSDQLGGGSEMLCLVGE